MLRRPGVNQYLIRMPAYVPPSRRHNFMFARSGPKPPASPLRKRDFPPLVDVQRTRKKALEEVPAYADVATGHGNDSAKTEQRETKELTGYMLLSTDRQTGRVQRRDLSEIRGGGNNEQMAADQYLRYLQSNRDLETGVLGRHSKFWGLPHLLDASEAERDKELADAEWSATLAHLEE